MTKPTYDQEFWESLWSKTLREHADKVSTRPPNVHLRAEAEKLSPGRALDAGCGHGAESIWLAARGFRVTAVDFSIAALDHARSTAEAAGRAVAERIDFVHADLTSWTPEAGGYDLVASVYVHVPGSVEAMVERLARGVTLGGLLLLVGHSAAGSQTQVSVEAAVAALDAREWTLLVAEERPRGGRRRRHLCSTESSSGILKMTSFRIG